MGRGLRATSARRSNLEQADLEFTGAGWRRAARSRTVVGQRGTEWNGELGETAG